MALTAEEREEFSQLVHQITPDQAYIGVRSAAHHAMGHCAYSPEAEYPDTPFSRYYKLLLKAVQS